MFVQEQDVNRVPRSTSKKKGFFGAWHPGSQENMFKEDSILHSNGGQTHVSDQFERSARSRRRL